MDILETFVVYLILFRLAIIIAGVVSIFLGYRLFAIGVWPKGNSGGTDVGANIAGSRLTLKNAAPGTCFALFGVIIITAMFIGGNPEMTFDSIKDAQSNVGMELSQDDATPADSTGAKVDEGRLRVVLRANTVSDISRNHKRYLQEFISCDTAYARLYRLVNSGG